MCCIGLLQGMVFYASIATLYRTAAGLSLYQISIIESVSYVLTVALEVPWGVIADRIGYRATMIICTILYFVSKVVFWQAYDFASFMLERVMLSVVISGLSGVDTSILYLSDPQDSHKVFSICGAMGTIGMIVAALVEAVWIKDQYRLAGLLTIFPYGIAAALTFFLREVKAADRHKSLHDVAAVLRQSLRQRDLLLLMIGAGLMSEPLHMIMVFLNQPAYARAGMSPGMIAMVFVVMMLLGLTSVYSARLTSRLGTMKAGIVLFAGAIGSALILAVTSDRIMLVAAIGLVNVAYAMFQPLFASCEHGMIRCDDRATALSVGAMIMDLLAAVVDLAIGWAADRSLGLAFVVSAVMLAAGMACWTQAVRYGR